MTGKTSTGPGAPTEQRPALSARLTLSRAARELGLKRGEIDLAVRLGRIRTVTEPSQGPEPPGMARARRRVDRTEIDRLRAPDGSFEALRESLRTVSAPQGAAELGITTVRFTKLARLGLLAPATYYVNRYRTVVWQYLAEEVKSFAADEGHESLLTHRLPERMRTQLEGGADLRARNWRGRHAGSLMRLAEDAWSRAAVPASLLEEDEVADVVRDPHERAYLAWLSPERPDAYPPDSLAAQAVDDLLKADDPEEIAWLRASLSLGVAEARKTQPVPRPAPGMQFHRRWHDEGSGASAAEAGSAGWSEPGAAGQARAKLAGGATQVEPPGEGTAPDEPTGADELTGRPPGGRRRPRGRRWPIGRLRRGRRRPGEEGSGRSPSLT